MDRLVFRRPLGVLIVMSAVLLLLTTVISPWSLSWVYVVVFICSFGLLTIRQRLKCTTNGVEVTVLATRRIAWASIHGFEAGSWWRGGTRVLTTTGPVWSSAPASWWGGPASPSDIAALERARTRD